MEGRGARARRAFGGPGIEPRWTRSAKDGVGTAYATSSRLWYTLSLGIITEAYFPTIDRPQLRDLQYLATDGHSFFKDGQKDLLTRRDAWFDMRWGSASPTTIARHGTRFAKRLSPTLIRPVSSCERGWTVWPQYSRPSSCMCCVPRTWRSAGGGTPLRSSPCRATVCSSHIRAPPGWRWARPLPSRDVRVAMWAPVTAGPTCTTTWS